MLINTAPSNEAVLSNVGEQGEFRIRNSAKAFSILSSGLYANKIKAIIRELSTNARDSHKEAGKPEVPFDVHLPTQLEPWFAIRDYGTGLDHEQVVNIYTTYFESTKTNSNDFVGCLGLGSKSPFAVTENFTVTAIKNGVKGIYTAFINDHGVPSIARMAHDETDEPSGVEVKFAVEDSRDFRKYYEEAEAVYAWFDVLPVFSGHTPRITGVQYSDVNIIPGVHALKSGRQSYAVMGGIAYPIDVPNADSSLGSLSYMLRCGLVIHFEIGELDFQASREGLSYIPQTIAAIKNKLEQLRDVLTTRLAAEFNAIPNMWDRTVSIIERHSQALWGAAAERYVVDNKPPTIVCAPGTWHHMRLERFILDAEDLKTKYNVVIRAARLDGLSYAAKTCYPEKDVSYVGSTSVKTETWKISPDASFIFVKNDTKTGALERVKHHYRKENHRGTVYVLDVADRSKPAKFDMLLAAMLNPPNVVLASSLHKKEKTKSVSQAVSIVKLMPKYEDYRSRYNHDKVWRDAGDLSDYDSKTVHFYLPLSGYSLESKWGYMDSKELVDLISRAGLCTEQVYGVRKSDIDSVKSLSNWIDLEDHVVKLLSDPTRKAKWAAALAMNRAVQDSTHSLPVFDEKVQARVATGSPYAMLATLTVSDTVPNESAIEQLCRRYKIAKLDYSNQVAQLSALIAKVANAYPMLKIVDSYAAKRSPELVAQYINMCDSQTT